MISIVDYGAGNIGSVLNMIRHVGGSATIARDPDQVRSASKILLPGVGSFDNAMTRLADLRLIDPLKERADAGIPFFGICLGMQLLANDSEEGSKAGLGLIPAHVRRFRFHGGEPRLKIPHMGWNHVSPVRSHPLTMGLEDQARFYFVHSYHVVCDREEDVLFASVYGNRFTSGVQHNNIIGVQFHPEKSHRFGMQLMRNFLSL